MDKLNLIGEWLKEEEFEVDPLSSGSLSVDGKIIFQNQKGRWTSPGSWDLKMVIWCHPCWEEWSLIPNEDSRYDFKVPLENPEFFEKLKAFLDNHENC